MTVEENLTTNPKFIKRFECLISHGLSIRTLCEITGMEAEEVAKYICTVWSKKNSANQEKFNYVSGNNSSMSYDMLLENQGIKEKEKIMIK